MNASKHAGMSWAVSFLIGVATLATAAPGAGASSPTGASSATCTGTADSPGLLAGSYAGSVVISGVCIVDGGPTTVHGNLTVSAGSALAADYAHDDTPGGTGPSTLTVIDNLTVAKGGSLVLGCESPYFTCADDPSGTSGDHIGGSLSASKSLAVIVHDSTIGASASVVGGGGGTTCAAPTTGFFAGTVFQYGVYMDFEDDTVGGALHVSGLRTCWMAILRTTVARNLSDEKNTFADPDADEVLQNTVDGSLHCAANSPAVQIGDSGASPNEVKGRATGECAFTITPPISLKLA